MTEIMKHLHCKKCLTSRTGDVEGEHCKTAGCDGIIEAETPFSELVDKLPEPMLCPRRSENPGPFKYSTEDHWLRHKSNGNRVCSYCGSLHPDDMFALVAESANAPLDAEWRSVVEIEPTDKKYKVYVHQPGVRNASEGAIKFYMQHLPKLPDGTINVTDDQQNKYAIACANSSKRFNNHMTLRYGQTHGKAN